MPAEKAGMTKDAFVEDIYEKAVKLYEAKEAEIGDSERMRELERVIMLRVIDQKWMDHIERYGPNAPGYWTPRLCAKRPAD